VSAYRSWLNARAFFEAADLVRANAAEGSVLSQRPLALVRLHLLGNAVELALQASLLGSVPIGGAPLGGGAADASRRGRSAESLLHRLERARRLGLDERLRRPASALAEVVAYLDRPHREGSLDFPHTQNTPAEADIIAAVRDLLDAAAPLRQAQAEEFGDTT
jgi:hypothetical protein